MESELSGRMPRTREDLLKLSGVGKYTASAVASIAYGQKVSLAIRTIIYLQRNLIFHTPPIDLQINICNPIWNILDK